MEHWAGWWRNGGASTNEWHGVNCWCDVSEIICVRKHNVTYVNGKRCWNSGNGQHSCNVQLGMIRDKYMGYQQQRGLELPSVNISLANGWTGEFWYGILASTVSASRRMNDPNGQTIMGRMQTLKYFPYRFCIICKSKISPLSRLFPVDVSETLHKNIHL